MSSVFNQKTNFQITIQNLQNLSLVISNILYEEKYCANKYTNSVELRTHLFLGKIRTKKTNIAEKITVMRRLS